MPPESRSRGQLRATPVRTSAPCTPWPSRSRQQCRAAALPRPGADHSGEDDGRCHSVGREGSWKSLGSLLRCRCRRKRRRGARARARGTAVV